MSSSINKLKELLSGEWILASKLNQNKVLDINSQNVIINDKNNANTQKWIVSFDTSSSTGRSFIIKNKSTNQLLTHDNGNAKLYDATTVYQGAILQRWYIHYQDDGSFIIANYVGEYLNPSVLDLTGSNTTNGTNIQSSQHSGNDNQRFYFIKA